MEYTNSPLVKRTSWSQYYGSPREYPITRITPHMYWGQKNLNSMCEYFADPDRKVSANYFISKDGEIGMAVEEGNRSWATNSVDNDGRAVTIEMASDQAPPYTVRPKAFESLVNLCVDVCKRNGKRKLLWLTDKARSLSYVQAPDEMLLTVHLWFFDTDCPGQYLMGKMDELAERVTALLANNVPDIPAGDMPPADDPAPEPEEVPETVPPPADPPASQSLRAADLSGLSDAEIVEKLGPLFTEEQHRSGILASLNMGQFVLESGCGHSTVFWYTNNGFGMKTWLSGNTWPGTVWDGESSYTATLPESRPDGTAYPITARYRKYPDIQTAIIDHSAYLLGATDDDEVREHLRYAGLRGCADYREAAKILLDGGYATDPEYAVNLIHVIEYWGLARFDLPPAAQQGEAADGVEFVAVPMPRLEALRQWLVNALDAVESCLNNNDAVG